MNSDQRRSKAKDLSAFIRVHPRRRFAMFWQRIILRLCAAALLAGSLFAATEQRGLVTFNGEPVPGVSVTATGDGKTFGAITDVRGSYVFPDLTDGKWTLRVEMPGFATIKEDIAVAPNEPPARFELKMLPLAEIKAAIQAPAATASAETAPTTKAKEEAPAESTAQLPEQDELTQRAADGFLINGSMNNGAMSPFAQAAAFGNNRFGARHLYNGSLGLILDNSVWDARPFSLSGQDTPKATYNRMTGVLTFGGPLQIPHLFKNGPMLFLGYQWTRNSDATTGTALMPDLALRNGLFANAIVDPLTGAPFPNNAIPQSRISPQAQALLNLYPLPNFASGGPYNYQVPILSPTHQDALQSRVMKTLGSKNQVYGGFALQSTRLDNPNLFGFLDTTDMLGINTSANWAHRLNYQWFLNLGVQFSRFASHVTPNFANRYNVSGDAGISGNNQDPMNWGPPSLVFANGIASLSDSRSSFDRNQTTGVSYSMQWNHGAHNITFGTDFSRRQFNYLSQQDPRGTFTFTGAATGNAFGDFLLGIPDASALAYGNADKYFRESLYDAYFTDDWRINAQLTVNAGMRWEYGAPITELFDRLVNLDIAPGFTASAPVTAGDPTGAVTGMQYPSSLVQPDKHAFEPRIGLAWRPRSGSSMVVRAGYGVYYDTSVYQTIALQMAQQPPFSKTLSVQNTAPYPLTLANGFNAPSTGNTFAIDPNFRVGYAQNWNLSIQRDLPFALQMTATYLGIKGTRGVQEFLPNTYPAGAVNPCPTCPSDFAYLASNGNSTRESAQFQLRRRLHNGFAATLLYTFSKSIDDDAALGGLGAPGPGSSPQSPAGPSGPGGIQGSSAIGLANLAIAQNWLDLAAERSLSNFDQRHLLSLQAQYTTGMGLGGGTLLNGWRGTLFKDWTFSTQITAGSGLPQTPIYLAPVEGTAVTGTIRPNYTGAPLYAAPPASHLNRSAYTAPLPGQWGNAGRNSITGPAKFTLNASLARTFRVSDRLNLDLRFDATNALNHVTYTGWNTTINNAQFGLPVAANAMRAMQMTLRVRF